MIMFVQLQFPIADVRRFQEDDVGRLPVPLWPSPGPKEQGFLRGFGPIVWRPRGGLPNWILEEFICEVGSFQLVPENKPAKPQEYKLLFCRLFHDGFCVTKVDIGVFIRGLDPDSMRLLTLKPRTIGIALEDLFRQRIQHSLTKKVIPLWQFGSFLKQQYLYATTASKKNGAGKYDLGLAAAYVESGSPVAFLELNTSSFNIVDEEEGALSAFQELAPKVFVRFSGATIAQQKIPVWSAVSGRSADKNAMRGLRLALTRVQTEVFCLRSVLSRIEQKQIAPKQGSEARDKLHAYLVEVKHRISLSKVLDNESAAGLLHAAMAYGQWRPAYVGSVLQQLAQLDLKRNIYLDTAKLLPYLDADETAALCGGRSIVVIAKEFVMQKKYEGQIGVINESGTVYAGNITQTSTVTQTTTAFDSKDLAMELAKALEAGKVAASSSDEFAQVAALAKAKEAAEKDDKAGVIGALKAAGNWTLDIATKVSASILTELIKKQIGP